MNEYTHRMKKIFGVFSLLALCWALLPAFAGPIVPSGINWDATLIYINHTPITDPIHGVTLDAASGHIQPFSCFGLSTVWEVPMSSLGLNVEVTGLEGLFDDCFQQTGDYRVRIIPVDLAGNTGAPVDYWFQIYPGNIDQAASQITTQALYDNARRSPTSPVGTSCNGSTNAGDEVLYANNTDVCRFSVLPKDTFGNTIFQTNIVTSGIFLHGLSPAIDANLGTNFTNGHSTSFAVNGDNTFIKGFDINAWAPTIVQVEDDDGDFQFAKTEDVLGTIRMNTRQINNDGSTSGTAGPLIEKTATFSFYPLIRGVRPYSNEDFLFSLGGQEEDPVINFLQLEPTDSPPNYVPNHQVVSNIGIGIDKQADLYAGKGSNGELRYASYYEDPPGSDNYTEDQVFNQALGFNNSLVPDDLNTGVRTPAIVEIPINIRPTGAGITTGNVALRTIAEYTIDLNGSIYTIRYPAGGTGYEDFFISDPSVLQDARILGYNTDGIALRLIGVDVEGRILANEDEVFLQESDGGENRNSVILGQDFSKDLSSAIRANAERLIRRSSNTTFTGTSSTVYFDASTMFTNSNIAVVEGKDVLVQDSATLAQRTITGQKTVIIKDGNLLIQNDLIAANDDARLGFILLNSTVEPYPETGNIFVREDVQDIIGAYYADGGFMAGSSQDFDSAQNGNSETNDDYQLRLEGTLFTRNTIGGSVVLNEFNEKMSISPWGNKDSSEDTTNWNGRTKDEIAKYYDLHFVRQYPGNDNLSYCVRSRQNASVCDDNNNAFIIRNPRKLQILTPPGFESTRRIR